MTGVHVLWFTGRSMTDLCSTTQRALMTGMMERNLAITFLNPDERVELEGQNFTHVPLPHRARRGLQSRTLANAMVRWLKSNPPSGAVAVVEWRVAPWVVPELDQQGIPWALMDRSPPADAGLLGRLQWRGWKAAWRMASRAQAPGFVVSPAHQAFVKGKTGHASAVVLQAGVDLSLFKPQPKRPTLTMVYHGRLDRHRGVLACAMLAQKARLEGLAVDVMFVGEGNLTPSLTALADANDFIHLHPPMPQASLAPLLASCHVGLLPMPKQTVWTLASPLKRSEYLACGLSVFGIDHEGHRLEGAHEDWFTLVPQEDFHLDGLERLQDRAIVEGQHVDHVRAFAEEHLGWSVSVNRLVEVLTTLHQKDS